MPTLTLPGNAPTRPVVRVQVRPGVDLLVWAARAWQRAVDRAEVLQAAANELAALDRRRLSGHAWLAAHPTHERTAEARERLAEIEHAVTQTTIAVRCLEVECWMACVESHGFRTNANDNPPAVEALWGELLPDWPVPVLHHIGGCLVVPGRQSLRSLLTRWPEGAE